MRSINLLLTYLLPVFSFSAGWDGSGPGVGPPSSTCGSCGNRAGQYVGVAVSRGHQDPVEFLDPINLS